MILMSWRSAMRSITHSIMADDDDAVEAKSEEGARATGNDGDDGRVGAFLSRRGRILESAVDSWWRRLPAGLEQIVAAAATEISRERAWHFLCRVFKSGEACRAPRLQDLYERHATSCKLATSLFMYGRINEAVYMMFYAATMLESICGGPAHLQWVLEGASTLDHVCSYCWFIGLVGLGASLSDSKKIHLLNALALSVEENPIQNFSLINLLTAEEAPDQAQAADLPFPVIPKVLCDHLMFISVTNLDDGRTTGLHCYRTMQLDWLLDRITKINPNKQHRILHKQRTLFRSSSGKRTLQELGVEDKDEIKIGGVCCSDDAHGPDFAKNAPRRKQEPKKKHMTSKGPKKKARRSPPVHVLSDEQLAKQHRQEHSQVLGQVLEELGPRLQNIRNGLHGMNLRKEAPKAKRLTARAKDVCPAPPRVSLPSARPIKKAGKGFYSILVGDKANLYRTAKQSIGILAIVDLHGCTKDEALAELDARLPAWVEAAMRGRRPWVVGVDVVCGKGSRILSDAVGKWIRANEQVAKRPK